MNVPPKPVTRSQEMAAQAVTLPAPADTPLRELLRSEAPPPNWKEFAERVEKAIGTTSLHDATQDGQIADLAGRLAKVETNVNAISQTVGGRAARVAEASEPPPPPEGSELPAPAATPAAPAPPAPAKEPTIVSRLEDIRRATGWAKVLLAAGAVFELVRWFEPLISSALRGLGK
jgi:hypothetical protein